MCANPFATPERFSVPSDVKWAEMLRTEPEKALATRADFDKNPLLEEGNCGVPTTLCIAVFSARGGSKVQVQSFSSSVALAVGGGGYG